jgi:polysaccharide biosynthesis/export protein
MFTPFPKTMPLLLLGMMTGCSHLPIDGPHARDIDRGAAAGLHGSRDAIVVDYALLDINRAILETLNEFPRESMHKTFGGTTTRTPLARIGAGDVIQVSIFESAAGGLFVPAEAAGRTGNFVSIPNLTVNREGNISVPYAGAIHAAGRTVTEVERDVEKKLASRAIEPQVSISFVEQNASMVSVVGEALNSASKFKISGSGDRVLDIVAKAGGLKFPGFEVYLTLQRKGRKATIHFPRLVEQPNENIYVAPGDILYAYREQQRFIAIGALGNTSQTSGVTGQFAFEQERLNLNEAIAKAGGLQDGRANPSEVFIYRAEHRHVLEKMGVDLGKFEENQQIIPTVYRANFRDPSSFFFAQGFQMRSRDVIYVANADANEVTKFLTYARIVTSTAAGFRQDSLLVSR